MLALTIYSRPGCHLCDDMKALVRRAIEARPGAVLQEIDISADPQLESLYAVEIPVLMLNGRKIAKYRISEDALARALAAADAISR